MVIVFIQSDSTNWIAPFENLNLEMGLEQAISTAFDAGNLAKWFLVRGFYHDVGPLPELINEGH